MGVKVTAIEFICILMSDVNMTADQFRPLTLFIMPQLNEQECSGSYTILHTFTATSDIFPDCHTLTLINSRQVEEAKVKITTSILCKNAPYQFLGFSRKPTHYTTPH